MLSPMLVFRKSMNFTLEIEPLPAGVPKIDVTVSLDLDGILTVTALDKNNKTGMEIRACKTTLSAGEVEYKKLQSQHREYKEESDELIKKIIKQSNNNAEVKSVLEDEPQSNLSKLKQLIANAQDDPTRTNLSTLEGRLVKQNEMVEKINALKQSKITPGISEVVDSHYHTIFIVDRSYSMRKKDSKFISGEVASRYASVFECINKYLNDRSFSDDIFSMLLFNNRARTGFKRLRFSGELLKKIERIQTKYPPHSSTSFTVAVSRINALMKIDSLSSGDANDDEEDNNNNNNTAGQEAEEFKKQVPESFSSIENTVIIFLSDGHDPEYQSACDIMTKLVGSKNSQNKISFYTIRFGDSKTAAESLEKLANAGQGAYSSAKDGIALNETFGEIQRAAEQKFNVWNSNPSTTAAVTDDGFISIGELIKKLLLKTDVVPDSDLTDKDFNRAFFGAFRLFLSPAELLASFVESYDMKPETHTPPEGAKFTVWSSQVQANIRIVFKSWVSMFPEDFKNLRAETEKFLESWRPNLRAEILELIEVSHKKGTSIETEKAVDSSSVPTDTPLTKLPEVEIATSIHLQFLRLYQGIKPYELLDTNSWKTLKNRNNSIVKIVKLSEKVTFWCVSFILSGASAATRASHIELLASVITHLFNFKSYQAITAVMNGLGHEIITRLKETKAAVKEDVKEKYLRDYNRMKKMEFKEDAKKDQGCVPWMEVYLSELAIIEGDGSTEKGKGWVNWGKIEKEWDVVLKAIAWQDVNTKEMTAGKWKESAAATAALKNFAHKTEKDLTALSKQHESDS
eukprot:TRINITY_DN3611_c0_g1_i3.p1 TRINITY_DN3611_c0_g1~~TRINITY_DN3611_c0_g1_i3.p1  ORF type:complete len:800 (-),score=179.86 TRINITY_DN3611_c0_g1_i3:72-2471(-)